MKRNYLSVSFLYVFVIALIFTSVSFFDPGVLALPFSVKPVNFLSDVQSDSTSVTDDYNLLTLNELTGNNQKGTGKSANANQNTSKGNKVSQIDPAKDSLLRKIQNLNTGDELIDFEVSEKESEQFFTKLSSLKKSNRQVRIAWYGDSFTDADLVVSDLRDSLQSVYGGNGVGFLPITHEAPAYRISVKHEFGGWKSGSVITRNGYRNFGINGHLYVPDSANYLRFSTTRRFKHTRKTDIFRIFYSATRDVEVRLAINDTIQRKVLLPKSSNPEMFSLNIKNIQKVRMRVPKTSGINFYGASLEDSTGIYIDNFSIKGNSGLSLMNISDNTLLKFDSLLNYDLIVLQFGLNAISSETRNFSSYVAGMNRLIAKFKRVFPDKPILLVSVSDRSERKNGNYITMESVKRLVEVQKKIAFDNGLLFWNLFQAMGGENSMVHFVNASPPLAAKDYTHLTFQGGKIIGRKLANCIILEEKKFKERRENIVTD